MPERLPRRLRTRVADERRVTYHREWADDDEPGPRLCTCQTRRPRPAECANCGGDGVVE